jgi:hypothetical protein
MAVAGLVALVGLRRGVQDETAAPADPVAAGENPDAGLRSSGRPA